MKLIILVVASLTLLSACGASPADTSKSSNSMTVGRGTAQTPAALVKAKFVVLTQPSLGFQENGSTYLLGQSTNDFLEKFGPAEQTMSLPEDGTYLSGTTSYDYVNDGVSVTADKSGYIKGILFALLPSDNSKAADVKTEAGIGKDASMREIVRIYGNPIKKREHDLLGYVHTEIFYQFGDGVLSFSFKNGILNKIGMNKDYLPWLD